MLRTADPFQLLTFTGPSAACLHTTCHIRLECSALGGIIISAVVKENSFRWSKGLWQNWKRKVVGSEKMCCTCCYVNS